MSSQVAVILFSVAIERDLHGVDLNYHQMDEAC
jgi:hypothetical protein